MNFAKYHGAGNDFIIIKNPDDNLLSNTNTKQKEISELCRRKTGIGADGLIELKPSQKADFKMIYYNSDGKEGTMCGNGGRCIAAFAWHNKIAGQTMQFEASDGIHEAKIIESLNNTSIVDLQIGNVTNIDIKNDYIIIDTGSPHYIKFANNIERINVYEEGKKIRFDNIFMPQGINVNFVEVFNDNLFVRTYERGVEDETLSCGTGVTAAAIASYIKNIKFKTNDYPVITRGGKLVVKFRENKKKNMFEDIWLKGEAVKVFQGNY